MRQKSKRQQSAQGQRAQRERVQEQSAKQQGTQRQRAQRQSIQGQNTQRERAQRQRTQQTASVQAQESAPQTGQSQRTSAQKRAARQRAKIRQLRVEQHESQENRQSWDKGGFPMWGKMLISVAVVLLLVLVFFRVADFEVSGNVRYTAEEVADASGITVGDILMGVNKTRTASRILTKLPYVQQVVISKALPGTVRFEIVECTAAACATAESGNTWLMTREGKLLEQSDEAAESAYPVIVGTELELPTLGAQAGFRDTERGAMAMKVLEAVCNAELEAGIQEINVSDLEQITVNYLERIQVQLGDGSDLDYKLQYMVQAVAQLDNTERGVLDLSFASGSQAVFHPVR